MMRVLTYTQILALADKGEVSLNRVKYFVSPELKAYLSAHLPEAGDNVVPPRMLLVAFEGEEDIVAFVPGGPPDPGIAP